MPFVSSPLHALQGPQPLFVGRVDEQRFFRQQILLPQAPTVHLLNVWGPEGCGVSTLLTRWREEAQRPPFQGQCAMVSIDGSTGSPLQVMNAAATQLRAAGTPLVAFEQMRAHFIATPSPLASPTQRVAHMLFARQVQELARTHPLQGHPVLGGMYEEVSETTQREVLDHHPTLAIQDAHTSEGRLVALTRAFLDDLTWLATTPVRGNAEQGTRVLFFLDGISAASEPLLAWLRTQVLTADLSMQVVLVLGSSEPLAPLLPSEAEVTALPLQPLTEEEAQEFLAALGITDPVHCSRLFQRTGGLPLALRLLAAVPVDQLDQEESPITSGVRCLEQQAPGYPYLIRYAALFSRTFDHQDLTVCPMFTAQELTLWYRRLLILPFVSAQGIAGKRAYHPLVQREVRQRFARETPSIVSQGRQAIVHYYQRQLARISFTPESPVPLSEAEQALMLALVEQWLWLADEHSQKQALEYTLLLDVRTTDRAALLTLLSTFAHPASAEGLPASSTHLATLLLTVTKAAMDQPAFVEAVTALLSLGEKQLDYSAVLQARLLQRRAAAELLQGQVQRAYEDSCQADLLDPHGANGTLLRGMICAALGKAAEALAAYNQTIQHFPGNVFALAHRALAYRAQQSYERALEESTRVVSLSPVLPEAALLRTLIYADIEQRRQGLGLFEARLARNPADSEAYLLQGMARCALGQYEQALASFAQAQAINPTDARIYAGRGHVHLERGDLVQARRELRKGWELDPADGMLGLLLAWVQLCLQEPEEQITALLAPIAERAADQEITLVCQGILALLQQEFAEALALLDQACQIAPQQGEAAFWKSIICAYLEQDAEALAALKQVRHAELPLPAILLTVWQRVAAVRPVFYQEQVLPLLPPLPPEILIDDEVSKR